MPRPAAKERRAHITTTLPPSLADELESYVRINKVHKNLVVENAIRAFLLKESKRQSEERK